MMTKTVVLGVCDYLGKRAVAIREMTGDVWRFVLIVDGERIPMLSY